MAPFDLEACIQQLLRKQLLHEALLREICEKTKEVLMRESNVVHISAPVTVVGDIHGSVLAIWSTNHLLKKALLSSQFYDLIEIFRIGGYAPHTNYLFLGSSYTHVPQKLSNSTCPKAITWTEAYSASKRYHYLPVSNYGTQIGCNLSEEITNQGP